MDQKPKMHPEWVGHPDTPLTKIGCEQAKVAGEELKRRISDIEADHGNIPAVTAMWTSPFYRCLQTSYGIAT